MASSSLLLGALTLNNAPVPQPLTQQPLPTEQAAAPIGQDSVQRRRPSLMEINFRGRYLSLPSSVLDIWYFNSNDPGANIPTRPKARGWATGVEFVVKKRPINWIFYYEYLGNSLGEGYWDDVEEPAQHEDGDWIRPDRFGLHTVGVNFAHEVEITPSDREVWLSMLFGAGLGISFVQGELVQWHPGSNETNTDTDCLSQSAAYDRVDECPADGAKDIPPVLPMVDISGAARVNFGDKANLRLDFGIHDLIYVGGAVGAVF